MFDKLKQIFGSQQGGGIVVFAPLEGECVPITEVNDPTFSQGMLGDGVAIKPSGGRVLAPMDGTLMVMFPTGHAASVVSDDGAEVLIHVGLDTVKLKGDHFSVRAKQGDRVKKGDLLLEFDREALAAAGYDTITPIVITNAGDYAKMDKLTGKQVHELDEIIRLHK